MPKYPWKLPPAAVALVKELLIEGDLTNKQIVDRLVDEGYPRIARQSIEYYERMAEVQDARRAVDEQALETGRARRRSRLQGLEDKLDRMEQVIEARAKEYADIPGGDTGLLTLSKRREGDMYLIDPVLLREYREYSKQIAEEVGGKLTNQVNVNSNISADEATTDEDRANKINELLKVAMQKSGIKKTMPAEPPISE